MVSYLLLSSMMLFGLSVAFLNNDMNLPVHPGNRLSLKTGHRLALRNILGKLIDTEVNTIYNINGQKQEGISSNVGATLTFNSPAKFQEDFACLEACYKCVEDYPIVPLKKKAADNCGPMCDCANSCSRIPIEQIDKIYGQSASSRGDTGCFWRTYIQSLNNEEASQH